MPALLAAILLVRGAVAGPVVDADEAYRRGDYQTALRLAEPVADAGDPTAQYRLGVMYERGKGLPQDYVALPSSSFDVRKYPARRTNRLQLELCAKRIALRLRVLSGRLSTRVDAPIIASPAQAVSRRTSDIAAKFEEAARTRLLALAGRSR